FPDSLWGFTRIQSLVGIQYGFLPLALPTLAALTPEQFDITLIDECVEPIGFDTPCDVVALTAFNVQSQRASEILHAFKARGRLTALGGPFATSSPAVCRPHTDILFLGEGEAIWPEFLQAIRKLFRSIATSSCSILAVMKHRAIARSESVQHKIYMTDLDHSSTGFYRVLIILTVSSTPTMPGVRPLNYPAFLQGRKALRTDWPCLHFDVPAWTLLRHPGVQSVMVILLIRKNRDETRKMVGVDVPEQERCRHPIIKPGTGNEHGQQ